MKHLIFFIGRLFWVLIYIMSFPLMVTVGIVIRTIWNFKPVQNFYDFVDWISEPFIVEEYVWSFKETYWAYTSPWQYLLGNKTILKNKNYIPPVPKTVITARDVKQKVQDTLDDIHV